MNSEFEKNLLALHYSYPLTLRKLKHLLADDPQLTRFHEWQPRRLAASLQMPEHQATRLQQTHRQALRLPLQPSYDKHFISPISYWHPLYPPSLKQLIDPPAILYAKGRTEMLQEGRNIAVIGSREATGYSADAMARIFPLLIERGFTIVSGMAKGADAMAHRQAMALGGRTIAVLGSGFLHPYPAENHDLFRQLSEEQLLLTEYPPYIKPEKWHFPMRNRIISGLSEGILVTEARGKSGTMSTIEHALDHGKEIFAVPGSVFSPLSEGPHKLIAEGAKPVWSGAQIVSEFHGI